VGSYALGTRAGRITGEEDVEEQEVMGKKTQEDTKETWRIRKGRRIKRR
jgi:hypothetical protein